LIRGGKKDTWRHGEGSRCISDIGEEISHLPAHPEEREGRRGLEVKLKEKGRTLLSHTSRRKRTTVEFPLSTKRGRGMEN